ncbi:MAG: hypothetical protein A2Y78_12270 [Acidobacteria bacterium RBG_13_68_16]|nr:MAG: hypothetical protein A2Y78_12270 [Acidobacteria bacterium RBG_13_68_16]
MHELDAHPLEKYGDDMRAACARAAVVFGVLAVAAVPSRLSAALMSERVRDVTFEVERSPGAQATYAACAEVVRMLSQRGWDAESVRVRIQGNPFDATASVADVVLGAGEPSEDSAFVLASTIVERQLRRSTDPSTARILAQSVAAHLSPPSSAHRLRWERAWLGRLGRGDIVTTALPEALWRAGGDVAMRRAAHGSLPESAIEALAAAGVESPLRVTGEVAVAGLLDPQALGFHRPPVPESAPSVTQHAPDVRFVGAGLRVVALQGDANAVAVFPVKSDRVEAWVAVRYALTGGFDLVGLKPDAEVTVPLEGVAWAGVVAVGLEPDAYLSLAVRPLVDYPVQIKRWDFLAGDRTVTLSWETQRHEGLRAFVVEALENGAPGSWTVLGRTMLPVADDGEASFGYAFVDEECDDVSAYRLLALTADGFLAEVGLFPLHGRP